MFKKALILFFVLVVVLSLTAFTFAQEAPTSTSETTTEETTIGAIGILPGNPFYFLKEWMRGIRRSFIFDPIEQVEFELKVTTEKGEELKQVSQLNRQEITEKAIANYEEAMAKLQDRFEELKTIANNPGVNQLLQQLAERTEQHQQLFEELSAKFESLRGRLEPVQNNWTNVISPLLESIGSVERVRTEITRMAESGIPGFEQMLKVMEETQGEINAQPVVETETNTSTSSEAVHSEPQAAESTEEYWTEERMQEANPYPMPTIDVNKLDSIILDVKKVLQIGQTEYAIEPAICADVYIPVCGEDGKLYSNECYAVRAGVNVAYDGPCKE